MIILDAQSGQLLRTFSLPPGVHNFLFAPDGTALFAVTPKGDVYRVDPDSGEISARVMAGSTRGLSWTADARQLIASGNNELLFLHPDRLVVERRITNLGVGQVFYPAATPEGRWILAPAVLDGVVLVIDAATGEVARRIATGSPLLFVLDAGGKGAWVSNVLVPAAMLGAGGMGREGGVVRLDLQSFAITHVPGTSDANGLALVNLP
jgi:DNA-binding beta-propeller fold protein YncE